MPAKKYAVSKHVRIIFSLWPFLLQHCLSHYSLNHKMTAKKRINQLWLIGVGMSFDNYIATKEVELTILSSVQKIKLTVVQKRKEVK